MGLLVVVGAGFCGLVEVDEKECVDMGWGRVAFVGERWRGEEDGTRREEWD